MVIFWTCFMRYKGFRASLSLYSASWYTIICCCFQKSSSAAFQPQKTYKLVRNASATHFSTNHVDLECLCKKKINCSRLQMTAALKLRLKQQFCRCYGLKLWQNTLRLQPHHLKLCCHFRRPICVKCGFLQ